MSRSVFPVALIFVALLTTGFLVQAGGTHTVAGSRYQGDVAMALDKINLVLPDLSLPKLGVPYSTPARLQAVDRAMNTPLSMLDSGAGLSALSRKRAPQTTYLADLLGYFGLPDLSPSIDDGVVTPHGKYISKLEEMNIASVERQRLANLVSSLVKITQRYQQVHTDIDDSLRKSLAADLQRLVQDRSDKVEHRRLSSDDLLRVGQYYPMAQEAEFLLLFLDVIEQFVRTSRLAVDTPVTWDTPLGRIRIAGQGNDTHNGHFFLLVDTGGNDSYHDVGTVPSQAGYTFVIDMAGNDRISWEKAVGPGAGIFGIGIWADVEGNDVYQGRNVGIGVGVFGAGVLWDGAGDDVYQAGSLSQGAGQYGIGVLIDNTGNDSFEAGFSSQGYAGSGGIGVLVNHDGDDVYRCGNLIPDLDERRKLRHSGNRYISMCQGYAFGRRPELSGGIGLLLDHAGNDSYEADIFAQGSSYWFGLGMLIDSSGNDTYSAYEHAQGESLHLGAGFLGDYAGDDSYTAYEHAQGVGIDRAVGILLDEKGDDNYLSVRDSQAAGIKPFGFGMLIDAAGNDSYSSRLRSQGYSKTLPKKFPQQQWPVGVLLDLGGKDTFSQPYADPVTRDGRIQNRQGIAIDYTGIIGQ